MLPVVLGASANIQEDWARTQACVGIGYSQLPGSDRQANLRKAISHYEATLNAYTRMDFPIDWARTQASLAAANWELQELNQPQQPTPPQRTQPG